MTPVLKWAGGKRWLVSRYSSCFKCDTSRYLEPFLGSGAVFFHLRPHKARLSDLNGELISTYQALRDAPGRVKRYLAIHQRMHSSQYYYQVREQKPRTPVTKAARFIYLNRTCFNGLYRVNKQGVFNVPKGTKDAVIYPNDNFEEISQILQSTELLSCDFADTVSIATEGDFLYIDPPYTVRHNNGNFLKYNEKIFSWSDQKRLADCLVQAASRGASILISNADHPCIHELYSEVFWQRLSVKRCSRIASSPEYRKSTTEGLISNYLNERGEIESSRG